MVTSKDINGMGGAALIALHNYSLYKILSSVYPDYKWLPWKFLRTSAGYWSNVNNQREFIEWLGNELKIKDLSDWYKVTRRVYF